MTLDSSPILQTAASGDASKLRDEIRSRALASLYYFTKVVLNFHDLSPTFHLPRCQEIQDSIWIRKRGFLWARGHFKSTCITKAYPLWRLCGGGDPGTPNFTDPTLDPRNRRILLIGESDNRVTSAISNIKWHILNNQMLAWLFPEIIPADVNVKGWKWRDDEILLPRSLSFDEGTFRAVGIGAKITGYHGDIFIFDDVIGEVAAQSEAEMARANNWIETSPGFYNKPETVEVLYVGTRWKHGTADVYGKLMAEMPFQLDEEGHPTGIKWFVHGAINEEGEVAFPERFSHRVLADLRRQLKEYKFSCQYLNSPTSPGGADFSPDDLQEFRVEEDASGKRNRIIPLDGSPPLYLWQLNRISFFDPSSGGKSAACENAIVVLGTASDGRQFVLDAFLQNCGYRHAIERWHQLNDQFVCHKNHYEAVGAQKTIEEFILERQLYRSCKICGKVHRKLIPIAVRPEGGRAKEDRIRAYLQPTVEEKRLYLNQKLIKLRQQITSFPHFDLLDGIDALAYAVHVSRRPSTEDEILDEYSSATPSAPPPSRVYSDRCYGGYI